MDRQLLGLIVAMEMNISFYALMLSIECAYAIERTCVCVYVQIDPSLRIPSRDMLSKQYRSRRNSAS
jgi:hypothetical protein